MTKTITAFNLLNTGDAGQSGSSNPWQTVSANYTAVAGDNLLADTTNGSFVITLPSNPAIGDTINIQDPTNNWETNNVSLMASVSINGYIDPYFLSISGNVEIVYNGSKWLATLAPSTFAANNNTGNIYAVFDQSVNIYNGSNYALITSIPNFNNPGNIGASNNYVYVTCYNSIAVIDKTSLNVVKTIAFSNYSYPEPPAGALVTSDNNVYVPNAQAGTIGVVNGNTNILTTINAFTAEQNQNPYIAIANGYLYTPTSAGIAGGINVINLSTNTITSTISLYYPEQMVVANGKLYVVSVGHNWMYVINLSTNTISSTITSFANQGQVAGLVADSAGENVYLGQSGIISVISTTTDSITRTFTTSSNYPVLYYANNLLYIGDEQGGASTTAAVDPNTGATVGSFSGGDSIFVDS